MTLTAPGQNVSQLRRRVHSLAKRIRRDYGAFEYCGATEYGPLHGNLHLGLLVYCDAYLPQGYLSAACRARNLGHVVDIRAADAGVVGYTAKDLVGYTAKDLDARGRVFVSRGWLPEVPLHVRFLTELGKAKVHVQGHKVRKRR